MKSTRAHGPRHRVARDLALDPARDPEGRDPADELGRGIEGNGRRGRPDPRRTPLRSRRGRRPTTPCAAGPARRSSGRPIRPPSTVRWSVSRSPPSWPPSATPGLRPPDGLRGGDGHDDGALRPALRGHGRTRGRLRRPAFPAGPRKRARLHDRLRARPGGARLRPRPLLRPDFPGCGLVRRRRRGGLDPAVPDRRRRLRTALRHPWRAHQRGAARARPPRPPGRLVLEPRAFARPDRPRRHLVRHPLRQDPARGRARRPAERALRDEGGRLGGGAPGSASATSPCRSSNPRPSRSSRSAGSTRRGPRPAGFDDRWRARFVEHDPAAPVVPVLLPAIRLR